MAKKNKYKYVPATVRTDFVASFAFLVGTSSLSLWLAWALFTHPKATETTDKLLALSVGLVCFIVGLRLLGKKLNDYIVNVFSVIGIGTFLTGVAIVEHKSMSKEHPMGFGLQVFMLTVILASLIPTLLNNLVVKNNKILKTILWIPATFALICVSLAFFQTRTTLLEPGHSEYVLNEMMAPSAGYNPYQAFVPQYAFLASWLVVPIFKLFSVVTATNILVLIFCAGGFLSLAISLFLAKKAFPKITFAFILIFILPFSTPTPGWNRVSFIGPASTLLSGPALRILGGMLVGFVSVVTAVRIFEGKAAKWQLIFTGALGSAVFWNNFDFGAAALLAMTLTFMFLAIFQKGEFRAAFLKLLIGISSGWVAVYLFLLAVGGAPNWKLFAWFARQFGGGFGSVTIEIPGPVLLDFPIIMSVATLGIYAIYRLVKSAEKTSNPWSAIVAAYFGMWSTFSLPYYINRSYHAGQMSMLYVPLSLALLATISILWNSIEFKWQWKIASHIFLALVTAFPIATILLIPNPSIEWDRLHGGNTDSTFPRAPMQKAIDSVSTAERVAKDNNFDLAYFGEGGNYVHMLTGINSVNIFNSPLDMFQSDASVQLSCQHLIEKGTKLLLLTDSARMTFAWKDGSLCDGLYRITAENQYLAIRQK